MSWHDFDWMGALVAATEAANRGDTATVEAIVASAPSGEQQGYYAEPAPSDEDAPPPVVSPTPVQNAPPPAPPPARAASIDDEGSEPVTEAYGLLAALQAAQGASARGDTATLDSIVAATNAALAKDPSGTALNAARASDFVEFFGPSAAPATLFPVAGGNPVAVALPLDGGSSVPNSSAQTPATPGRSTVPYVTRTAAPLVATTPPGYVTPVLGAVERTAGVAARAVSTPEGKTLAVIGVGVLLAVLLMRSGSKRR